MERDIKQLLDPAIFARQVLGFTPDPNQERVLRSRSRRILLNCTRQWGKSTVTAAKAVHRAIYSPESLVIAMSPSSRQTGELLRKMQTFLRQAKQKVTGDGDNEMSLLLANGSRIVGLPGGEANIRGFSSVGLLIVDEASRVPDASYRAARPMIAVGGGSLMLMSTPFGKRGFFHEEWMGSGRWNRLQIKAEDCPRIPKEFLEEERRSLGDLWFRQEYCCEFIENESQLFTDDMLLRALDDSVKPLF